MTKNARLLTDVELELMNIVWNLGECTVKDVLSAVASERDLAYTSVATVMKILEQKRILKSMKREKAHVFTALLSREEYETITLKHVAEHVFQGDPTSMVMRLIDDSNLGEEELKAIKSHLQERLKLQ